MSKANELFRCQRCGKCCEQLGLPWDAQKAKDIAAYLHITINDLIEKFYGTYIDDGKAVDLDDQKRIPCPFVRREPGGMALCTVYPVRPSDCVSFPVYPLRYDFMECPAVRSIVNEIRSNEGK
jgi:Fe-S-cluster containining protein